MKPEHLDQAHRTISTWAFKHIVLHHLKTGQPMSVVRMQDLEVKIMRDIANGVSLDSTLQGFSDDTKAWADFLTWSGLTGITYREVSRRLQLAVDETKYFAPSLSGLTMPDFDLLPYFNHSRLVDNSFVSVWTEKDREELFDAAHSVLIIHGNQAVGDNYQRALTYHRAGYLKLSSWEQADNMIIEASRLPHRLVLFAGAAGAKYIGPAIAKAGKVVIDVGFQMERWIPRQQ